MRASSNGRPSPAYVQTAHAHMCAATASVPAAATFRGGQRAFALPLAAAAAARRRRSGAARGARIMPSAKAAEDGWWTAESKHWVHVHSDKVSFARRGVAHARDRPCAPSAYASAALMHSGRAAVALTFHIGQHTNLSVSDGGATPTVKPETLLTSAKPGLQEFKDVVDNAPNVVLVGAVPWCQISAS